MNRMRHTTTAVVFCLFTVLSGAGLPAAAERPAELPAELPDDEKITAPMPVTPERSGTVILVPTPSPSPATPAPGQTVIVPQPPGTSPPDKPAPVEIPVVPVVPDRIAPVEVPVIPVLPDRTSPVEIPVIPVPPQTPDRTTVLTPPRQQETPQKEAIAPYSASPPPETPPVPEPGKQASPMDFLPMPTLLDPEKTQGEPKAKREKLPSPAKDKPPSKAPPDEPKAQTPQKAEQSKPKSGDPLRIPPEAAKTGDLAFLEGCWRATYPEGRTKRTLHERLCFDKNGKGKRFLEDPKYGATCTSATQGKLDAKGRLTVVNDRGPCSNGGYTGATYMVCEGEGNATPCFWRFPDLGGTTQRYKIPLVRE